MIRRLFSNNWTLRAQAITGLDKEIGIDQPSFWKESRKEDIYVGVFQVVAQGLGDKVI